MNQTIARLFDLTGKSALVSGATGALGSAAARALAGAGAHVTIAGGNAGKLGALADELAATARRDHLRGPPRHRKRLQRNGRGSRRRRARAGHSGACLGHRGGQAAVEMEPATWDKVMDANVRQTWLLCRAAGQVMIPQGRGGAVIPISSVRAHFATPAGTSAYGASKAAVDMIARSLATEWGPHDIRVNAIAPTVFRSELTAWLFEDNDRANEARKGVLSRIPLGRLAEPDDFAGVLVFLASQASAIITGETINVDGGFSAN